MKHNVCLTEEVTCFASTVICPPSADVISCSTIGPANEHMTEAWRADLRVGRSHGRDGARPSMRLSYIQLPEQP